MGELKKRLDRIEELYNTIDENPIAKIDEIYNCINVINKIICLKSSRYIEDDNNITVNDSNINDMEELRDLDEFKDRKKESPSDNSSSNKSVLPDNTTVDDALEDELEALKKEYNDTIDMIDDKKRQVQDTVPDHLRQVLNGEVDQTLSDETQKELDEIEYVSSLETTDDAVEYILTKCGVKNTLAGVKNIKYLEFVCDERHDLNMKSDMNEVISLIAEKCHTKPQQVKKNLQNLINHADFTKTTLINLFKMPKETITPEYLLQEFIEFYQYDPEEEDGSEEDKKEEA